jgi:hypothetical protein
VFPSLSYSRPHRNQAAVLYGMKLAVVAAAYFLAGKIGLVVPFTRSHCETRYAPNCL